MLGDNINKQLTKPAQRLSKEPTEENKPKDLHLNLPIPYAIGPYKIECLLEKGGMSVLYIGHHPQTNELTTIKVLSPRFLSNQDLVQIFLKEAEIIALTDHPNIVKLYGHGEWENGVYIAMEYIQGASLRDVLLEEPITLKESLKIVVDIAYALCHLHTHGVIHRDLKPENILISENREVKVIDFGIAQLLTESSENTPHPKQRLIGTPIYMSPEQRENPESVSYPSDIYSLGIITYELVLGKLSHGHLYLSLMPKGLQKILQKTLQPKPEDRYQDVVDFIADITSYLNSDQFVSENRAADKLSEMIDTLHETKSRVANQTLPKWDGIDLGFTPCHGFTSPSCICDFFTFSDLSFGIFLAESSASGALGCLHMAELRGALKAFSALSTDSKALPIAIQNSILANFIGHSETSKEISISYLQLIPKENKFCFFSSGKTSLWSLTPFLHKTTKVQNVQGESPWAEDSGSWNVDDVLILIGSKNVDEIIENASLQLHQMQAQKNHRHPFKTNLAIHSPKRWKKSIGNDCSKKEIILNLCSI